MTAISSRIRDRQIFVVVGVLFAIAVIGHLRGTLTLGEAVRLALILATLLLQAIAIAGAATTQFKSEGASEKLGMALNGLFVGLLPILCSVTTWLDFADYPSPRFSVLTGLVLGGVGLLVFWQAHRDLGRYFSKFVELKEDHKLVTTGIYRLVRHPLYTSLFLMALGQALLISNWLVGPAALVSFLWIYLFRIPEEEAVLETKFGQDYRDYIGRTGRLLPRLNALGRAAT